jgi:hypothetical protein
MPELRTIFEERLAEIDAYLNLLDAIQARIATGARWVGTEVRVTEQQQRILHSSVYLQLYNLVESTITRCIDAIGEAAAQGENWQPSDLSERLRRQWVRALTRIEAGLNENNALERTMQVFEWLASRRPVSKFAILKGAGGNWDDREIEDFAQKLGVTLSIDASIQTEVRRHRRNDKGALALVRSLRNDLAHGRISFEECGAPDTVSDLRILRDWTAAYLREIVEHFQSFIDRHEYLLADRRPAGGAA